MKTKFLILSDSHYGSVNDSKVISKLLGKRLKSLEYDCALLAGDIGITDKEIQSFLKKYFKDKKVCFLGGNHITYLPDNTQTLSEINQHYKEVYPLSSDWSFMENDYKIIDNTVVIGCNLYTDYKYHRGTKYHYLCKELEMIKEKAFTTNDYIKYNKNIAKKTMNDFVYGKVMTSSGIQNITPDDYEVLHKQSLKYIDKIYKQFENTDYKIVVMTHHCPSSKCISPIYYNSDLNASFVSDLDKWILKHPKIELWVCGHVHSATDTYIGNTRLICNPIGYIPYNEHKGFEPYVYEI